MMVRTLRRNRHHVIDVTRQQLLQGSPNRLDLTKDTMNVMYVTRHYYQELAFAGQL